MRVSQFFLSTLKEAPAEADVVSQKLMVRAGLIRRLASGIYTWMPLGLRVLRRVESIIREEMNRAGALELVMPAVQPAELWRESGRWDTFGPDMLKIKDRHDRDFCFGPTHEEVITDIVRKEIRSYRQLPLNFYQIQTKFRDEIRPRFGVMRAREFIMKDAYSFDVDNAGLQKSYQSMYHAYMRIFTRLGLKFRAVAADTGAIGGSASHEFQVLADSGEDQIAYSLESEYAANLELAEALAPQTTRPTAAESMQRVATPGRTRCEEVAELLGVPLSRTVKALSLVANGKMYMLLIRGDHALNEVKVSKLKDFGNFRWASDYEITSALGCDPGYLGPVGLRSDVGLIADRSVAVMADFVCGANERDYHLRGVNFDRDCREADEVVDVRNVVVGDLSPDGKGTLAIRRGIEVGHVFALGTKYSAAMNAVYLDPDGRSRLIEMGCYGIGVTRIVAAAIEQCHDERGIIWADSMAPFHVAIAPIGYGRSLPVKEIADKLHAELTDAGIDVLLDDRNERPGVMFADLDLIGIPHRVTIGDRGIKDEVWEYACRRDRTVTSVPFRDIVTFLTKRIGI